ncbi:PREDICTED: protein Shroom1-like [Nanorana parkeri]|uniref:protein Shroom1-like n=1 Tax=Nanorana parkeri TaxID=125878 RepID=UPI0008544BB3|nr:PREDICTED: protein Shroom1-like [Nanorana parkeri]
MALSEVSSTCDENYQSSQTVKSNKDCFQGMDIHTEKPFSLESEEYTHNNHFDSTVDNPQREGKTSKSTRRSWNEFVSDKLRGYKKKAGSWKPAKEVNCYDGTKSEEVEKLALNQQQKEQYQLLTQNTKDMECDNLGKYDIKYKRPHTRTSQIVYGVHIDDLYEQPLASLNRDDLLDIPKAHNLRKDATIKPIPLLSQKLDVRPQSSNFCDLPSEKITKASTPMLYHLACSNNSSLAMLNTSIQTKQLDTCKESNTFQKKEMNFFISRRCATHEVAKLSVGSHCTRHTAREGPQVAACLCSVLLRVQLCVMGDNAASETENVFRNRGKSMEELGTSNKTRLSVLSQSSDPIYHVKVATLVPRPESTSGTAVLHQDHLKACAEYESGKQPRQTSQEDFLEPHISVVGKSAQEKHSGSQRTSAVSSDNSSSTPPSQFYPMAAEISPCMKVEDKVFNCMQQEQDIHYTAEDNPPSHGTLPLHLNTHIASLEPSDEDLPGYDNEVRADVNDLCESSAVKEPPFLTTEYRDTEAVSKQTTSTDFRSMSSIQQEELEPNPASQVISTQTASAVGYDEYSRSNGSTGQEMDASMQEKRDTAMEDLTGVVQKPPTEERCAELVREIVSKDKSLVDILKPLPMRASAISLMKNLFHVDISVQEKCRNRGLKKEKMNLEGMSKSHSKTMLLLQRKSDECPNEITSKKMELMSHINSQLEELFAQRESLLSEISDNTTHGTDLEVVVKEVCKPNEYERYMMFIGDLEKVVSLLFCLTTRLARVENALSRTDEDTDADEMQSLKERHSLLTRQREDAKDLKDNLDRREQVVTGILAKYLNEAQLEGYKLYVRLKTYFLIEQKDLEEKIKFHEEQLESLHNSIPP